MMFARLFKRGSTGPMKVRRGAVECFLSARAAVAAGVPQDRWLSLRLARHGAQAPVEEVPMSVTAVIEGGAYAEIPGPHPDNVWDRARLDPAGEWEPDEVGTFGVQVRATRALMQAKGERLNRDRAAMQAELARLRADTMDLRDRRADATLDAQHAIAGGLTVPEGTLARAAEVRGRPTALPRWPLLACAGIAASGLLAEGTALLSVFANANGIVPAELGQTWETAPLVVAGCAVQAVSATGAMLMCLEGARHFSGRLLRGEARGWRAAAYGLVLVAALGTYVAVGAVAAALRHDLQAATSSGAELGWAHGPLGMAVLTWAFPLLAAGAIELARAYAHWSATRDAEIARWNDVEEGRRLRDDRDRGLLAALDRESAELDSHAQSAEERLRSLEAEAEAMQATLQARATAWRTQEQAWHQALAAAIAEDTLVYGWVAARMDRLHLVARGGAGAPVPADGESSGPRRALGPWSEQR